MENLQRLHHHGGRPRRRVPLALALLLSVLLWVAVLTLLVAVIS